MLFSSLRLKLFGEEGVGRANLRMVEIAKRHGSVSLIRQKRKVFDFQSIWLARFPLFSVQLLLLLTFPPPILVVAGLQVPWLGRGRRRVVARCDAENGA